MVSGYDRSPPDDQYEPKFGSGTQFTLVILFAVMVFASFGWLINWHGITPVQYASMIVGRASVIDGDTIDIHGTRIRFDGIDAPESHQKCLDKAGASYRCGKASADALDTFLAASRPTTCHRTGKDRNRIVAICTRADGTNVNQWLVASGHAIDWPKYSKGRYAAEQRQAENAKVGIWAGSFEKPCLVRRARCE